MATGLILGGISAATSVVGGIKKHSDAKKAGRAQADMDAASLANYKLELGESISRTRQQQSITEGQTNANIGASGFAAGSSLDRYMSQMQQDHASDISWMETSGASMENIMAKESSAKQRNIKSQGSDALFSGFSGAIAPAGRAYESYKKYGWGGK